MHKLMECVYLLLNFILIYIFPIIIFITMYFFKNKLLY